MKLKHLVLQKMQRLRSEGISCELFHEHVKLDKQFKYAEKKNIPFVIIIGETELANNNCVIKNISNGHQETKAFDDIRGYLTTAGHT